MSPHLYRLMLLTLLFYTIAANAQSCPQSVTSLMAESMVNHPEVPGVQLALSSPRCSLECRTSISSNATEYANEPPLLVDSPWRIASITKTFTAVAALRLAEQEVLDLHAPIVNYLPTWASGYLQQQQGISDASQITTWMLLHHTSGLDHHAGDTRFLTEVQANPHRRWTLRDILKWAADNLMPVGSPGVVFHYSDTGYTYLSLIVEILAERDLATAVRELNRLNELDTRHTYWEILEPAPPTILPRAGQYYGPLDVTRWDASFDLYGAGGLVSNSEDLNKFTRALHTGQILGSSAMELMYTTESSGYYGCGVLITSFAGHQAWGHTGFWKSWTYYVPSLDLVFSGTSNQGAGVMFDLERLVENVAQNCFSGRDRTAWSSTADLRRICPSALLDTGLSDQNPLQRAIRP